MSATISSTAASASSTSCATSKFNQLPTQDIACAIGSSSGIPSNSTDILKKCCKSASVESYADDCAVYCLSIDQTVADLQKCFQDEGANPAIVFCRGNGTQTATGKSSGSATETGSKASGSAAKSSAAAPAILPPQHMSKAGLGMLAILLVSTVFGALL